MIQHSSNFYKIEHTSPHNGGKHKIKIDCIMVDNENGIFLIAGSDLPAFLCILVKQCFSFSKPRDLF